MLLNCDLEKTLESPLCCKEIQPVHPKGNQSWIFIGRTDAEAETPILWPPDGRTDSFEKTLMLWKIEGKRRRGWQRMRGLMASPTLWTLVWISSGCWWWTGNPSVLQSMELQKVGQEWVTEQQQYCDISCLCHTVCSSHSAYSESPPIFLRRSLGLLWALLGQLLLISGLTWACSFFQSPQLPPKSTVLS